MVSSSSWPVQVSLHDSRKFPISKEEKSHCLSHISVTSLSTEKIISTSISTSIFISIFEAWQPWIKIHFAPSYSMNTLEQTIHPLYKPYFFPIIYINCTRLVSELNKITCKIWSVWHLAIGKISVIFFHQSSSLWALFFFLLFPPTKHYPSIILHKKPKISQISYLRILTFIYRTTKSTFSH